MHCGLMMVNVNLKKMNECAVSIQLLTYCFAVSGPPHMVEEEARTVPDPRKCLAGSSCDKVASGDHPMDIL